MIDVDAIHRAAVAPRDLAHHLGLETEPGSNTSRVRVSCPWHNEQHPSCTISTRAGRLVAYCHSCHAGGDLLALVAAVHGLDHRVDFQEVAKLSAELVGVSLESDGPTRPRARTRCAGDELATRIDAAAVAWISGRDMRFDESLATVAEEQHIEALDLLRDADEIAREESDELETALAAVDLERSHLWN